MPYPSPYTMVRAAFNRLFVPYLATLLLLALCVPGPEGKAIEVVIALCDGEGDG